MLVAGREPARGRVVGPRANMIDRPRQFRRVLVPRVPEPVADIALHLVPPEARFEQGVVVAIHSAVGVDVGSRIEDALAPPVDIGTDDVVHGHVAVGVDIAGPNQERYAVRRVLHPLQHLAAGLGDEDDIAAPVLHVVDEVGEGVLRGAHAVRRVVPRRA